ncbi:hypothetical protein [Flavobacterium sp. LC2016-12]|uniref:hypothetical protein n=1 Tax=Flavobacterium sp. LC2016-12 TaxID=2783794 RepID=UPI00188C387B|nr:hypothetical protein [Flavobacterium sp. LC2016-12]MBF4467391.1 hypothetical protein [Flavobacterium sp. LC2016-12]
MKNLNKIKILIVALTSVLALTDFESKNTRKGIFKLHHSTLSSTVCQSDFIQISHKV